MGETLLLSPGELYYLGWLLKAEYIDYAYMAAVPGTGGNFRLFAKEASAALAAKGILQEDFSGNFELDPTAARLLRPIFFGGREMTVDLCRLDGDRAVTAYKFHFLGDLAVMVNCQGEKLMISQTGSQDIMEAVAGLLPQEREQEAAELSPEDVSWILAVKSVCLGGGAERALFVMDAGGALYRELPGERTENVQTEDVLAAAAKMLEVCKHGVSG